VSTSKRSSAANLAHKLSPLLGLALFGFALWLLHRELRNYHYADLVRELRNLPRARLWWAVGLTVVSWAVMTLYDGLGVRYVRRRLSYGRIATASLVGYGVSMTLGFPLLTGAPLRYRMYSRWGLSPGEIARIIAFYSTTFWLGLLAVGGFSLLADPPALPPELGIDPAWMRPTGALLLGLMTGYFILAALGARISIRGFRVEMPSLRMALAQVGASSLDWLTATAVVYALLPPNAPSFLAFFGIFIVGQTIGHASHVPGGVGVFESVVLYFLSPRVPAPAVLGALLAWRAIYYLLPLGAAILTLIVHELRRARSRAAAEPMAGWYSALAPQVLAVTTFIGGTILLFSGATPLEPDRIARLQRFLPIPVTETAHLLASLAGVALLLLARGLQMRLRAAWRAAVIVLAAGMALSLLKGLDWEESAILLPMLVALVASRGRFRRRGALLDEPYTAGWLVGLAVVSVATAWIGFFAYNHVPYDAGLWLRFGADADASRFLRASLGGALLMAAFGAAHLLHPAHARPAPPSERDLDDAARIARGSPRTDASLALLGDKSLLFNPERTAFLMYAVAGRSWVALGDPVGPAEEREELAWRFREEADRHGAMPVFYLVSHDALGTYLDMGLALLKLGEEAVVKLAGFSLDDEARRPLRRSWSEARRRGLTFEVVPADGVPALLPELKAVSDAWLARRNAREKGFSTGRFDPAYLARFPAAVARLNGRVVAFANVWTAAPGSELTVDLMRYAPGAPPSVMEFLFVELMRWGREAGYAEFNLGMAPLAGLQARETASRWNRMGALVFRHGEHFQNIHGLRRYKERFGAEWRLKYLAAPGGLALPRILASVAALISGGGREGDGPAEAVRAA
jgi:phosphatidylglycerol lysyltransferase